MDRETADLVQGALLLEGVAAAAITAAVAAVARVPYRRAFVPVLGGLLVRAFFVHSIAATSYEEEAEEEAEEDIWLDLWGDPPEGVGT